MVSVKWTHLERISDRFGVFEHCRFTEPDPQHGYCVDDVARALIVLEREDDVPPGAAEVKRVCQEFLSLAQQPDGTVVNRRATEGDFHGAATTEDHWGRALWAWGTTAARDSDEERAALALACFERSAVLRGPALRSMVFAALGACEVLEVDPSHSVARGLLADAADLIDRGIRACASPAWPWPESRLTYANAAIPEVLIGAGSSLDDAGLLERGLHLLRWLTQLQTRAGLLSVVPSGGWGPGDLPPGFDQQPIEIAGIVDASARAYALTHDEFWLIQIHRAALWFQGFNDSGVFMYDPRTWAGFDGLRPHGRNANQGAESTIAYLSVMQQFQRHFKEI